MDLEYPVCKPGIESEAVRKLNCSEISMFPVPYLVSLAFPCLLEHVGSVTAGDVKSFLSSGI
jgi:hypothetical protein